MLDAQILHCLSVLFFIYLFCFVLELNSVIEHSTNLLVNEIFIYTLYPEADT